MDDLAAARVVVDLGGNDRGSQHPVAGDADRQATDARVGSQLGRPPVDGHPAALRRIVDPQLDVAEVEALVRRGQDLERRLLDRESLRQAPCVDPVLRVGGRRSRASV